ncbi:cold shock domain-containing protein [Escherichia sp. E4385]|uniref:cold shock domain-containing protein n=1 Tax=Escherichia sp. E4385 TaxID=2040639 RepID=UPI00107F2980|nr:cold shock domain-containing protein [Escherichia sp. E4385]
MEGVIKWFSEEKGYGFITDKNNKDYYFHVSDINGALLPEKGNNVSFDIEISLKGERARKVIITQKAKNTSSDDRLDFCRCCNKKSFPTDDYLPGGTTKNSISILCGNNKSFLKKSSIFDLFIELFDFILSTIAMLFEVIAWIFNLFIDKKK